MPQPTRLPRRARAARLAPEERRALLTEARIHVFARRGIGAARPTDVATDAGVSEATVYVYFPTRDDLVTAVLDVVVWVKTPSRVIHSPDHFAMTASTRR